MWNQEAVKAIKDHLGKQFGVNIEQQSPGLTHRYKIETNPTHWIYISYHFLADAGADAIIEIIDNQVLGQLRSSTKSRWIAIESKGVKDVDETYGK